MTSVILYTVMAYAIQLYVITRLHTTRECVYYIHTYRQTDRHTDRQRDKCYRKHYRVASRVAKSV